MELDAAERARIEERLTELERDLALIETGRTGGRSLDEGAIRNERNRLRGRLAAFGRDRSGNPTAASPAGARLVEEGATAETEG